MNIPHGFEEYWRLKTSRTGLHQAEQREAFEAGVKFATANTPVQPPRKNERKKDEQKFQAPSGEESRDTSAIGVVEP